MKYADVENGAFPLEPAARAPIAHDAIHRLYGESQYGRTSNPNVPAIGGASAKYDAPKWAAVHAEAVRGMLDAGYQHRLRCDGTLDHSLPQDLFDRSMPPRDAQIDAQAVLSAQDGGEIEGTFLAQGAVMAEAPVDVQIPADVLARIKAVDPEPFLVAGMVSEAGTVVNGVLYTPALLKEMQAQLPTVQHPEHMDRERGAFARRPNASYMLAGALTPDGKRLYGKAWIPASQAELVAEVKAGFAAGLPPAWSTECHSKLVKRGDHFEPVPGTAKLISIDWVETGRPGVPGAGPTRVISAQKQTPKEEKMDETTGAAFMAALTLESLTAGRKDLVEGIISAQATSTAEKTELENLRKENKELKAKVGEFEAATLTAQLNTRRTELLSAVKDEKLRNIADGLLSGQSVAELDKNWPGVQERIKPLTESMPIVHGGADKGQKKPEGLNF